jgi:hypothetical protein
LGNWVNKEALANFARAFSYSALVLFLLELNLQKKLSSASRLRPFDANPGETSNGTKYAHFHFLIPN